MKENRILQDDSQAARLLKMTCDTLLFLNNDGTCVDMVVKTENNPYVNDQHTLLGKNIFSYFPEETLRELRPAIEYVIQTGEMSTANYNLPSKDKLFFFKCIIQKYDDNHLLCQYRDITSRSQMKQKLELANERLIETSRAAKIGYWSFNTVTKIISYSGYVGILFDTDDIMNFTLDEYIGSIFHEDQEKIREVLERQDPGLESIDYRFVNDRVYYLRMKIVNVYHTNKGEMIINGYTQNIDDIISSWDQLKMVTMAINNSNESIFATKMDGSFDFINHLCRTQCQIAKDVDIKTLKAYEVLEYFSDKSAWNNFVRNLRANNDTLRYINNHSNPNSNVISSDCTSFIFRNEYGEDLIWHLCRDISEQVRYENELKKAKFQAEESDRLKSAFISNMSHEIRTPLNSIVGFSAIMATIDNAEERMKYSGIIESSNKQLLLLIDEVLDLSKIESGTIEFNYTPVKLNDLCRETIMMHQIHSSAASLLLELPDEDICIKTDKSRLMQVISNLINNAIKFIPKGTVTLGYRLITDFVEFYVKDTGIGIPEEKLDKIFNRFEKINQFAPGTGLGLSICRSIVEHLGGDISVTSEVGVGSVFSFRIPLQFTAFGDENKQKQSVLNPAQQSEGKEKATILVTDEIDDNFELIRVMIGSGYRLLHAKDGSEAIQLLEKDHPDLILMDIKMPKEEGLEAIRAIRQKASFSLPIIAVSAYAYEEDKQELLNCGCSDFLAKPLNKEILITAINKYL